MLISACNKDNNNTPLFYGLTEDQIRTYAYNWAYNGTPFLFIATVLWRMNYFSTPSRLCTFILPGFCHQLYALGTLLKVFKDNNVNYFDWDLNGVTFGTYLVSLIQSILTREEGIFISSLTTPTTIIIRRTVFLSSLLMPEKLGYCPRCLPRGLYPRLNCSNGSGTIS